MIRLNCFFQATDGDQYKDALRAAVAVAEIEACGQMKLERFEF